MSKWKRTVFGYRCSYFDVFVVALSVSISHTFGHWIGLLSVIMLAGISGAMSFYVEGDRP